MCILTTEYYSAREEVIHNMDDPKNTALKALHNLVLTFIISSIVTSFLLTTPWPINFRRLSIIFDHKH